MYNASLLCAQGWTQKLSMNVMIVEDYLVLCDNYVVLLMSMPKVFHACDLNERPS